MSVFHLKIVSPDELFLDKEVEALTARTTEGDVTILRNHTDYLTYLKVGMVTIKENGKKRKATISGGILQVQQNEAVIITSSVEWLEEIDLDRAEKAKTKAEAAIAKLSEHKSEQELELAEFKLKKALNRINASK